MKQRQRPSVAPRIFVVAIQLAGCGNVRSPTADPDAAVTSESDASCTGSTCPVVCPHGEVACSGTCIDPSTNAQHCGAGASCAAAEVGQVCAANESCTAGMCEPLPVPPGFRRVFVTSTLYTGNLGGLAGADAKCQQHANAAGLPGMFKAWLASTTETPLTRFTHAAVPYTLVDGTVIATNWDDLVDSRISAPLQLTESGGRAPLGTNTCNGGGTRVAWSNVANNGDRIGDATAPFSCDSWTFGGESSPILGGGGNIDGVASGAEFVAWSNWCNGFACSITAPIYCFQQ